MFGAYETEGLFALQVVEEAVALARRIQGEMVTPQLEKQDRSPVTVADFASQAIIASRLQDAFPSDPLVAEEGSGELRRPQGAAALRAVVRYVREVRPDADAEMVWSRLDHGAGEPVGRYWVLDPIDGTAGFLRGDQWVVALALIEDGEVVVGCLGCPRLDREGRPDFSGSGSLLVAARGEGAWIRSMAGADYFPLHVSACSEPAQARILGSVEPGHTDMELMYRLRRALGSRHDLLRMDSQAKFAAVACGRGELVFRLLSPDRLAYREKVWDQAAGSRVVQEAGGRVTDLRGRPLDFAAGRRLTNNLGVVVSNGALHGPALRAVRQEGAHHPELQV